MNEIFSHTITNPRDGINKDRFSIKENWFTVCDGVSADGPEGARAAEIAISKVEKTSQLQTKTDCKQFILSINRNILNSCRGSTTFTSVMLKNSKLILLHTGDSECRTVNKNGVVKEITTPFTVSYGKYLSGIIKREEVSRDYHSNILVECLGMSNPINPQVEVFDLTNVKYIILNSDGANYCLENQMLEICENNTRNPAKEICETALKQGSRDDITVIVVKLNN